jgi:hypothetical protein
MSHTDTMKQAFLNKHVQFPLKAAHDMVVKAWEVLVRMSCTVVIVDGYQKSKRLSYMAKFKHEVVLCTEEKGNHKATAIFGVDKSNVKLWRKHTPAISECMVSRNKFPGPKKG